MEINNIVIAGAGIMGSSMAQIYAKYFDNVTLYNHREESLKKAEDRIKENVEILVKSGEMDKEAADKLLSSITYTAGMEANHVQGGKKIRLSQCICVCSNRRCRIFLYNTLP